MTRSFLRIAILLLCTGCGSSPSAPSAAPGNRSTDGRENGPIQAVATVGMVADIVRNVAREHVRVVQIMGTGVDPHLYRVTRDDVQTLISGDIIFYSGLMLEGKMTDTLVKVADSKPVFAVTEMIDTAELLEPEEFAGHYDPHVWMDASAWSECVAAVGKAMTEMDPAHVADYRSHAEEYQRQLAGLHAYGVKSIATVPKKSRLLVTSHDAFNYFGRAYGLEVEGIQGISTESEAGLRRINELVDQLVSRNVRAVFVESSVPRKNIEAIVEGSRARNHEITIGGELFSDAMGEAGTYRGTYIGMLDHNITLVTRGLGGEAPLKGMQGKLSHTPDESE